MMISYSNVKKASICRSQKLIPHSAADIPHLTRHFANARLCAANFSA
jgi:hypothetical protein